MVGPAGPHRLGDGRQPSDRDRGPRSVPEADALLNAVADRCAARGITAHRDVYVVALQRTTSSPPWGRDGDRKLSIGVDIDSGRWVLAPTPPSLGGIHLIGACTPAGIDAMLDVATAINTGQHSYAFS